MFQRMVMSVALCAALVGGAWAQPQLQELAVTAVAGPGWDIQVQGSRVAVYSKLGLIFFRYDSTANTLTQTSTLQLPEDISQMKFHRTRPLLYFTMNTLQNYSLFAVDLADLSSPRLYKIEGRRFTHLNSFDLDTNFLYTAGYSILKTYSLSNPEHPVMVSSIGVTSGIPKIAIDGHILHIIDGDPMWAYSEYRLFNFIDPLSPYQLLYTQTHHGFFTR